MLLSVWRFRHFILTAIRRDFTNRYTRSRLGLLWSILHPLAMAIIFALVLGEMLGARFPGAEKGAYPVYLLAGMSAWGLFAEIINRSLTVFIDFAGMMKKIAFPRLCLPAIVVGTALINHLLVLAAAGLVGLALGYPPSLAWLVLPLAMVPLSLLALGIGVVLGIFNVWARDVAPVTSVILQLWFWLTPIVYARGVLPGRLRWLDDINPLGPFISCYQAALLRAPLPEATALVAPLLLALGIFTAALLLFRRASAEIVDAL